MPEGDVAALFGCPVVLAGWHGLVGYLLFPGEGWGKAWVLWVWEGWGVVVSGGGEIGVGKRI